MSPRGPSLVSGRFSRQATPGLGPPRPARHEESGDCLFARTVRVATVPPRPLTQRGGMAVSRLVGRGVSLSAGAFASARRLPGTFDGSPILAAQLASRRVMRRSAVPSNLDERERSSLPLRRSRALCLGSSALCLRRFWKHGRRTDHAAQTPDRYRSARTPWARRVA